MKFKDIEAKCKKLGYKLIEFEDIKEQNYDNVKLIDDFFDISDNIIGYTTCNYTSEEATDIFTEKIYNGLSTNFKNWLEERHDGEIRRLCKQPDCELITLLSVKNRLTWVQSDNVSDSRMERILETISKYHEDFSEELREKEERKTEEINSLIDSYKERYSKAILMKDRDSIVRELSGKLLANYGLDGRSNPNYKKELLRARLEGY